VKVVTDYVDDFVNLAKCRAVTQKEIAAGAGVVFEVAGACGAGGLQVAKERHVWGVGVDTDQARLGPHILTSAIFRPKDATYLAIKDFVGGTWTARSDVVLTLGNGGVGLGRISTKVSPRRLRRLDTVRRQIAAGKITIPRVPG
jgi:basic membrane protein A and related proteins